MYFGYILYSKSLDKYYVGHTQDLYDRIFRHNNSGSKYTKVAKDWELKYSVEFSIRLEAMQWEKMVKGKKSRVFIENLIKGKCIPNFILEGYGFSRKIGKKFSTTYLPPLIQIQKRNLAK